MPPLESVVSAAPSAATAATAAAASTADDQEGKECMWLPVMMEMHSNQKVEGTHFIRGTAGTPERVETAAAPPECRIRHIILPSVRHDDPNIVLEMTMASERFAKGALMGLVTTQCIKDDLIHDTVGSTMRNLIAPLFLDARRDRVKLREFVDFVQELYMCSKSPEAMRLASEYWKQAFAPCQ